MKEILAAMGFPIRGEKPVQRLLSLNEAAFYLGTDPQSLRIFIWRGQIPKRAIIRMGLSGRVYLDKLVLDEWIDSLRGEKRK